MDKLPPFTVARVETFPLHAKVPGSPQMSLGEMAGRPALLVRIEDGDGAYGWGEVWANFPPRAHFHKADLIEDVIAPRILGQDFDHPGALAAACDRALSRYALHVGQPLVFEHCYAGLDTAAWDLALRKAGRSAAEHFGFAEGARVYASSLNEDAFSATAADWLGRGVGGCKIKVGYDRARDLAFIRRARDELPQSVDLMIDANQAWEVEEALEVASAVAATAIAFVEEPIRADRPLRDWAAVSRAFTAPTAAGENIYGTAAFDAFRDLGGLRILQPDIAKWGGLSGARQVMETAGAANGKSAALWPHFMGSAVGQWASLVVSALAGPESRCEFDVNANPLRSELTAEPFAVRDGRIAWPDRAGLVPEPAGEALGRFRADRGD